MTYSLNITGSSTDIFNNNKERKVQLLISARGMAFKWKSFISAEHGILLFAHLTFSCSSTLINTKSKLKPAKRIKRKAYGSFMAPLPATAWFLRCAWENPRSTYLHGVTSFHIDDGWTEVFLEFAPISTLRIFRNAWTLTEEREN